MYYGNMPKEENTTLCFQSFKNGDGVQKLVASMPDDLGLGEWELHTIQDRRWNDNQQRSIEDPGQDIIKSMRWSMRQPTYAGHLIYAHQWCFIRDSPLKHRYTEMHTARCWWETQVSRNTPGWWGGNRHQVNAPSRGYAGSHDLHGWRNTSLEFCGR